MRTRPSTEGHADLCRRQTLRHNLKRPSQHDRGRVFAKDMRCGGRRTGRFRARMLQGRQITPDGGFLEDRRWFPIDLDRSTGAIQFADMGTDRRLTWNEFLEIAAGERQVPLKNLPARDAFSLVARNPEPARINFIWHTSYCCSTAIASALDVPGRNMSIFEPQLLVSVAGARRDADKMRRGDISWLSDAAFHLLGRPYFEDASVTIKPAPVSNCLVEEAAAKTKGKMLFLYADCRSFLLAAMRYGENRRRIVRHLFNVIYRDEEATARWTPESVAGLTDLEIAGLAWQLMIARFENCLNRFGSRAASLDCDAFLENPREVLAKIWNFLELPGSVEESALYSDPKFLTCHAKYADRAFAREARLAAEKGLSPEIVGEIDKTVEAVMAQFPQGSGTLPLPNALATAQKALTQ